MATVAAMMASASSPALAVNIRAGPGSMSLSRISRSTATPIGKRTFLVRCQGDDESKVPSQSTPAVGVQPSAPSSSPPPLPPRPAPAPKPKVSTKFGDVFAFTGPAPETINGRLAMLGFVSALGVELGTGHSLSGQLGDGGIKWFLVVAALFTYASLVPMFKGVTKESRSKGFFSATAETWNGRAAMIGLVALAITEFVTGSPLV